jgi:hypothetical protein
MAIQIAIAHTELDRLQPAYGKIPLIFGLSS